jgi:hypothetical protein
VRRGTNVNLLFFLLKFKTKTRQSFAVSEVKYPVSATYKVLDGYDIYRSDNLIVALVVVESQFGRDLRLYRWMKRKDQWKVDLCRMGVKRWKWAEISTKALEFMAKYNLKGLADKEEPEES